MITFQFSLLIFSFRPTGQFAYAFTQNFLLMYDLDTDTISTQFGNVIWPDTSFIPHAVDVSRDLHFVVVGYVGDSSTKYIPCAYLLNILNSSFNVLDTWLYTPPTSTSWQASLTNWDANVYAPKYDMSVGINSVGNQVLVGIPITNTIVLLDIDQLNHQFGSSFQTLSNGKAIGMGKSVGWLDTNSILVLVNTYSFNYIWSSSQVLSYNITVPNSFVVISIFPNIQQTLTATFGPVLLSLVLTQNGTVVMLDSQGNYYILLPSAAGSFSDSSSGTSSSPSLCIAGTFTSESGIFPCSLCPTGTTTYGLIGQSACLPCGNEIFCPLGAAFGDTNMSAFFLTSINQVRAYPVSPQSVRFDNILIENMFSIRSDLGSHCLLVSPLLWTVIVISLGLIVWLIMLIFKHYVTHPMGKKTHLHMEEFFKKADLIGEGEMGIGGLFSFAVIVLIVFAYVFSNSYFYRYPIEQVSGDFNLACDTTLTNAQFSTGLMAIGIPPNDDIAPIFALIDAQPFTLRIDFINAVFNCTDITVTQIKDINLPMTIFSCNDTASSASVLLPLPSQDINLQIELTGRNNIGGFRIGLEAPGVDMENKTLNAAYTLFDLAFAQALYVNGRLLTQEPSCTIQITKVINRTYSLEDKGESKFGGIWLPVITGSLDEMFVDENEYKYGKSSSIVLSIMISETSYYTLNTQWPIASHDEVVFTNLLFTIVCLDIFGLGFLVCKLIIVPLIKRVFGYYRC
jgi:hypothetical protein